MHARRPCRAGSPARLPPRPPARACPIPTQAFWDILPYETFSVRINRHNMHRLFDLLDAISPEQVAEMQQGLADNYKWVVCGATSEGM